MIQQLAVFLVLCCFPLTVFAHMRGSASPAVATALIAPVVGPDRLAAVEQAAAEFDLPIEPQRFLEAFIGWPTGLYPGTLEMLARIPRSYRRAILSNSNALHWPRVLNEMQLGAAFDSHFVSHLTGRIKPDPDAFEHVVESLGCVAGQVLFLDDNMMNVHAAQACGMHAIRVRGAMEAQLALTDLGIIAAADGA